MKKQVNLKEVIKNAPKGLKLYSPAYGEVYFECIENDSTDTPLAPMIVCKSKSGNIKKFFADGSISTNGECMLFPDDSKTWNDWQKVLLSVGDIVSLKDFNKVCKIVDRLGENQVRVRDTKDFICIYDLTDCTFADNKEIEEYNKSVQVHPAPITTKQKEIPINNSTTVINLIGGPGCGKSTIAAGLFYEMKKLGIKCELVCEYTKEKVWEESFNTLKDEIYLFAKQLHKQWRLKGKVDFIITDHCLLNSVIYDKEKSESFSNLIFDEFNKFNNINFFIARDKKYETAGRIETLEESIKLDQDFKDLFNKNKIKYQELNYNTAVNDILDGLGFIIKCGIDPYKLDLGDFITIGSDGFQIVSIVNYIKEDDLYDTVRLIIWDDGRKELKINPINALDELNKHMFSYRKATDYEKKLLLEEMQKNGWTWNSYRNIIEVYDI